MTRKAKLGLACILALGLFVAYLLVPTRDLVDRSLCERLYRAARTSADTAAVDVRLAPPERGRGQGLRPPACGELRRLGK